MKYSAIIALFLGEASADCRSDATCARKNWISKSCCADFDCHRTCRRVHHKTDSCGKKANGKKAEDFVDYKHPKTGKWCLFDDSDGPYKWDDDLDNDSFDDDDFDKVKYSKKIFAKYCKKWKSVGHGERTMQLYKCNYKRKTKFCRRKADGHLSCTDDEHSQDLSDRWHGHYPKKKVVDPKPVDPQPKPVDPKKPNDKVLTVKYLPHFFSEFRCKHRYTERDGDKHYFCQGKTVKGKHIKNLRCEKDGRTGYFSCSSDQLKYHRISKYERNVRDQYKRHKRDPRRYHDDSNTDDDFDGFWSDDDMVAQVEDYDDFLEKLDVGFMI